MADDKSPDSEIEATEDDSNQEALVPRDFFMGKDLEVGKKCEVRIEGIYDDEVAISYVKHKKSKDGKDKDSSDDNSDDSDDTMKGALSRMDRMTVEPAPPMQGGY